MAEGGGASGDIEEVVVNEDCAGYPSCCDGSPGKRRCEGMRLPLFLSKSPSSNDRLLLLGYAMAVD